MTINYFDRKLPTVKKSMTIDAPKARRTFDPLPSRLTIVTVMGLSLLVAIYPMMERDASYSHNARQIEAAIDISQLQPPVDRMSYQPEYVPIPKHKPQIAALYAEGMIK